MSEFNVLNKNECEYPVGLRLDWDASNWTGVEPPAVFRHHRSDELSRLRDLLQQGTSRRQYYSQAAEEASMRSINQRRSIANDECCPASILVDFASSRLSTTKIFKTLVLTHVECKNHITPPGILRGASEYMKAPAITQSQVSARSSINDDDIVEYQDANTFAEEDGLLVNSSADYSICSRETITSNYKSESSNGTTAKRRRQSDDDISKKTFSIGASPEQPERVAAVFAALQTCKWECGSVRILDTKELETSPRLSSAIDDNLSNWAAPHRSPTRARRHDVAHTLIEDLSGLQTSSSSSNNTHKTFFPDASTSRTSRNDPPPRTHSVSYYFDDVEPIVLSVHDQSYLSRIANEIEKIVEDTPHYINTSDNVDKMDLLEERAKHLCSAKLIKKDESIDKNKPNTLFRCVSLTATGDTYASARSLHAALCASYSACRAVDAVLSGEYRNAFVVVRPPGHHAGATGSTTDDSGQNLVGQGFCIINHVAVAARYALANHAASLRRVAVIDFDLHAGNGTQQILCADDGPMARDHLRDSVLFCSIHGASREGEEPHLFPGTARATDKKYSSKSRHRTSNAVNIPIVAGAGHAEFIDKFQNELIPAVEKFNPDIIIVSAGFDGHKDDYFKFLRLTDKTYKVITESLMDLADRVCDGRIVSVLEGGYDINTLVRCSTIHVRALATYKQPLPITNTSSRGIPPRAVASARSMDFLSNPQSSDLAAAVALASSREGAFHFPT